MPRAPKSFRPAHLVGARQASRRAKVADPFYSSARWRAFRLLVLAACPVCADCERRGITSASVAADHIIPRRERPDLAFVLENMQGLCRACHTRKTVKGQ